jgi:membrane-anchored protein YejM (alkaline phosphatase superfamily)
MSFPFGCSTPPQEYSQGVLILSVKGRSFVVVAGWDVCAILDRDNAIVLPLGAYNIGGCEARTAGDYRLVDDERAVFRQKQGMIMSVMKGMSTFLR